MSDVYGSEASAATIRPDADQRDWQRKPISTDIFIVPLDDELAGCGKLFRGKTKDVSTNGLSFFHATPLHSRFVSATISMPSGAVNLLVDVARTTAISDSLFLSAGALIRRLDD